ncbi:MAG: ATP-dependent DNA helicase UvrD/PcrA [Parcubacteria group bacterium GW2011_GWB1_52_7]|nr:MAG: ATP-dependent DNA helicase UvrD/PcrA [Parcubacteria group bacterium GW2011_GWA1_51_12]KKW28707.1 MAG: ATP-dependent DNA helicase UvrD/PcrA [Parcubacteria group bacterium GW2011_GWB1_52_7]
MEHILKGLNEKQRQAVLAPDGPILIIAGAGSGKTKALTHRVAYLLARGVPPGEMLAVTFTNKAAEEMRTRIGKLLQNPGIRDQNLEIRDQRLGDTHYLSSNLLALSSGAMPFIGTFHSFALHILRREAKKLGFTPRFSVFDEDDSLALLKEVTKDLNISAEQYPAGTIQNIISSLKNQLIASDEYASEEGPFAKTIARVYTEYQRRLKDANAMDFDDLLMCLVALFEKDWETLEFYQNRFRYIHIDEYQDTNHAQYRLVTLLASKHRNIFAIGDDAQSIYSWRGADFANILSFEKDWPDAAVIILDQNYRSTQNILDAAHGVISKNILQKEKKLWTENQKGENIFLVPVANERHEAAFIAEKIADLFESNHHPEEIAVLYRTNAQSRVIEESLIRAGIPYRIVGGVKFYQRREIKDLVAYLRVLENERDIVSLRRIANVPPRGIGRVAMAKLLADDAKAMNAREQVTTAGFLGLLADLKTEKLKSAPAAFLKYLVKKILYQTYLADDSRSSEERWENVKEFISLARRYDDLPTEEAYTKLLEDVALVQETDDLNLRARAVHLMSLHAAKGLEFRAVFIVGLEEGIFPHGRAMLSPAELEEERRLCYVGITRAKEKLYLLWAAHRMVFGSTQVNPPSRFLKEIPAEVYDVHNTNLLGEGILDDDYLVKEDE